MLYKKLKFQFYIEMSKIREISDADFKAEVLDSSTPVLVDFWAPWCGPCRAIAPVVEELSTELDGKVKIFKMNIDENPQTPSSLGIRSIPTLKVFVGGQETNQMVGAGSKDQIKGLVAGHLG